MGSFHLAAHSPAHAKQETDAAPEAGMSLAHLTQRGPLCYIAAIGLDLCAAGPRERTSDSATGPGG